MEINMFNFKSADGTENFDAAFNELGYLNATEAYQFFGKSRQSFNQWKDSNLVPYAEKLIELGKVACQRLIDTSDNQPITVDDLIIVRQGGRSHEQGTWLHPKLAIVFARWCRLEFEIWCDEKIAELLLYGTVTLLPEDQEYVDHVESLFDLSPGSKLFMAKVEKILLIYEKEGYNIKTFKDLIAILRTNLAKEAQIQVFKKIRSLIRLMYESGQLSRTSHELMLEYCVNTVVEVLEKEVSRSKRLIRKIELRIPAGPSIAELTTTTKAEHDNAIKTAAGLVDARSLYCHKFFGFSPIKQETEIPMYLFGPQRSVAECRLKVVEEGYKLAFGNKMIVPPYNDQTHNPPALIYKELGGVLNAGLWWQKNGDAFCKLTKSFRDETGVWVNKILMEIMLISYPTIEPSLFTGTNDSNTIRVVFSSLSNYLMVYGIPETKINFTK